MECDRISIVFFQNNATIFRASGPSEVIGDAMREMCLCASERIFRELIGRGACPRSGNQQTDKAFSSAQVREPSAEDAL